MDILQARVKKGCCHAADHLFRIWESKYRSPQRKPYYDIQIDEHELLHTDWFWLLLDHEAECEKKNEYSARNALRLLSDLAKNGNQEALDMLRGIGMKIGGSSACWAGDVYYERKEYKKPWNAIWQENMCTNWVECMNEAKAPHPIWKSILLL